jgi:hypothetical protein
VSQYHETLLTKVEAGNFKWLVSNASTHLGLLTHNVFLWEIGKHDEGCIIYWSNEVEETRSHLLQCNLDPKSFDKHCQHKYSHTQDSQLVYSHFQQWQQQDHEL